MDNYITRYQGPSQAELMANWYARTGLGKNLGYGSAFGNPLSPNRNKELFLAPDSIANELERDGIVPRYYGKNLRVYPKHAAQPYTLNYGNGFKFHCVFILGYGPLGISDLRIGAKPITDFGTDIEYELRYGWPGDSPLTLFTQDVNEEEPNQMVAFGSEIVSQMGLSNAVLIDLYFPNGLYQKQTVTTQSGASVTTTLARDVGIFINVRRKSDGGSVYAATTHFNLNAQGPFYRTINLGGFATAEYEVTIQRATAQGDQQTVVDAVQCIAVKGVKYGYPINPYRDATGAVIPIAYVALRCTGTAKTQGALDAFNCKVTSKLQTWNGANWVVVDSNAPADIVADLLCGTVSPRPIPRTRLNGAAFQTWKTKTEAGGYYFNDRFVSADETIEDAISDVAFAGRGLYIPRDENGLHSCRFEEAQSTIDQYVTPLNSRNFKWSKTWGDIPHAIKAQWISQEDDTVQEETIIPRPGYTATTARTFESQTFRGVTSHTQVVKLARYHWACALDRPTVYEFEMPIEYMLLKLGSRIKVTNDLIGFGLGESRVKGLILDASSNCIGITVREPFEMVATRQYAIRVRLNDGTSIYQQVNAVEGLNTSLTFTNNIPNAQPMPAVGDLVQYSYLNAEADLIVTDITPGQDFTANIQAVDYSPSVYTAADTGVIPPYTPPISIPEKAKNYIPPEPEIVGILSDENVMLQYGTTQIPRMKIAFRVPATDRIEFVQYAVRRDDEAYFGAPSVVHAEAAEIYVSDVREGVLYHIQLRSVADNNYKSGWVETSHTIVGRSTPPPDITSMYPQGDVMQLALPAMPLDFSHVQVRINFARNGNWDQAVILIDRLLSSSFPLDILPDGLITVLAKAFDTAGNESVNARVLIHDFGATVTENVYLQEDSQPTWADCTITNGTVVAGEVVADDTGSKMYTSASAKFYSHVPGAKVYSGGYKELTVERVYTPRSDITEPWILKLDYDVDAENYHVFFKAPGSGKFYNGNPAVPFYSGVPGAKVYTGNGNEYRPWTGERIGKKRKVSIKIVCPASTIKQAKVSRLGVIADMPDIEEDFKNQVIAPGGTNITLQKSYRQITSCVPVLQADAAYPSAASAQIISALPYTPSTGNDGPVLKVFDVALAATSGKVAGKVKGW